jgi:AraC-like DNA-binding protein
MPDFFKNKAHPSLSEFVKEYWYIYWANSSPTPLSNTPTPEEAICFFPRNLPFSKVEGKFVKTTDTFIIRQSTTRVDMLIPEDYIMFKIIFQTGGFYKLFGVPMSLFANGHTETISVLGNSVVELKEQIANAKNFKEMTSFVDKYLMSKAKTIKTYQHPIDFVINQKGLYHYSLDRLASDACISNRQFERKFFERTGVTPKLYQRILKFNEAMKIKKNTPKLSWFDITYMVGYYDQMHLLRDFKQFTDITPTAFDFDKAIIY